MLEHLRCDFCGSDDPQPLFDAVDTNYHRPGQFRLVRCQTCHLVFLDPRPTAESLGRYYPDRDYGCYQHRDGAGPFATTDPLVRLVAAAPGARVRICDVGCGDGAFLDAARQTGWDVAGVEINVYARQRCVDRLGEGVVAPSFAAARFPDESFDVVTFWHVLEHLPSPASALAEAERILKPGGVLALAVPNFGSLEAFLWRQDWIWVMAPTHFYHFTRPTLARYLARYGFAVVRIRQEGGAPSLAANLLRTLRVAILDPFTRQRGASAPASSDVERLSEHHRPFDPLTVSPVDPRTKRRLNLWTTTLVSPIARLIDLVGVGPELKVYARKGENTRVARGR